MIVVFIASIGFKYTGPPVNFHLNNQTCDRDIISNGRGGYVKQIGNSDYSVLPGECDNASSAVSWAAGHDNLNPCSCRNGPVGWAGFPILGQNEQPNKCEPVQAAYTWLYGQPQEGFPWLTIPYQQNYTIPANLKGFSFDPDGVDDSNELNCGNITLIKRLNFCFYNISDTGSLLDVVIPISQKAFNETTELCNTITPNSSFYAECCSYYEVDGGPNRSYVSRPVYYAAACDMKTRDYRNADGKYHTGAETNWNRTQFTNMKEPRIVEFIKGLVESNQYNPSQVRTSNNKAGFNGVRYSFSGSFSAKTVTLSAGDRNDITDLTASCIVPRKALDAKKASYEDVHFDDFDFLKRWALHTLLSNDDSLKNGDKEFMNPSVHGRASISRDSNNLNFHAWATQMDQKSANVVRDYVTNGRGAFPNLYYKYYAENTPPYTVKNPTNKTEANTAYFQMCPVDYAKRGGSFLPSYQYFYQPGKDDYYWEYQNGKWGQYPYSDYLQYSQFSKTPIDCKLASGNVTFLSYTDPDPSGQEFNFKLNCSSDPNWAQIFTDILNARETAGKLTPQTRLREDDPLNIATVTSSSTPVTASIDEGSQYHKRRLGFKHPSVYGKEQTDDLYPSGPADNKLPDSASRIASFYFKNFDGDIYEGQTYQIESAVISCPTCLKHNHNGAASLFPDAPVLGTRPRIDDLVGSDFVDIMVKEKASIPGGICPKLGACPCDNPDDPFDSKCYLPKTTKQFFQSTCKDADSFQGGKADYLDVNAESICAVTEFQECFIAEPTNSTSKSKSPDFFMGLNQYGTGSSTQFSLMNTSMNQELFNGQTGFNRMICSYYGSPIRHSFKDTCNPRKYDPIVPNPSSPQACSNARVRFRQSRDYAVWPTLPTGDFSKSLSFNDAPTMIFVSGQDSGYDVDKETGIFNGNMQKNSVKYPWYSQLGDLAPNYTSFTRSSDGKKITYTNTNITLPGKKVTGNDCYQCTDPENIQFFDCYGDDGDLPDPVYTGPSPCNPVTYEGFCKIEQLTCTSPGKQNSFNPCIPPRTENTGVPCGFWFGNSNCYDNRRPTAAGPCPPEKTEAKPGGWWKNSFHGLGPVRIGESNTYSLLLGKPIDIEIETESFIKKLYEDPSNPDGNYASIPFVSIKSKFYFPDEKVDEVYADGTFDFCSDVSTAFNDTIQKYHLQGKKITVYPSKSSSKNITDTLLSPSTQTCIGNLHGFPQSSPGICVANEKVEQLAAKEPSSTEKKCDSPGSALPQCGNPAFFTNKTGGPKLFPPNPNTLHGSVYAHYCLRTDGSPLGKNPKEISDLNNFTDNKFVECDEDVFSPTDRQTFCSTGGIGAGFGGVGIQASRVSISGRKDEFVCSNEGGGCIAFAADSAYSLQKVIDLGQKTFGTKGFTVYVIPVNISVMNNLPLGPSFYDMTKQNGFFESQSDTNVPNEFKVFNDKTSMIKSAFCDGGNSFVDAKQELVDLVESMRQTSTGNCPGYKTGVCPKDSYCVPSLEATPSMAHVSCVSREEMFPPIFDSDIEVRVPNVIIQPLWGKPSESPELGFDADMVRFGPLDGKSPSCVRVKVTAPNVILNKMFFDQTACLGLEESKMVPIVVSGSSAVDSAFTNIVMVGNPSAAVVVTGNRNDGDAPFIDVAGSKVAAVKQIITADANPKEGIIVAFARTIGDHLIQQCGEVDNPSLPDPCTLANTNIEGCSSRGCPTQRCGTHNYTGLTKAILEQKNSGFIIVPVDVTARPKNNIIVNKAFDGHALLEEEGDNICFDAVDQGTLKSIDCDDINAKFWVTNQQIGNYYRLELENRPFTAVYINDTDYSSLYLLPAHGCDATEVDSVLECDQDNADQANVIKKGPVPSNNSIILGQDFFGGQFYYVEIDVKTGACGRIKNCRPECFRPTEELCDLDEKTGITEYICRFEIAKRGAIASVKISGGPSCIAYGSSVGIVQPGSSGNATLRCDGNLKIWILDNPGTNYTSGPATSDDGSLELVVGVAEALIQPYDSGMVQTVVFGSVNLINVSEFTNIFGKAFENVIFASSTSRGYYISAAAGCVVVATIMTILAVHRIVRRDTIVGKNIKQD